MGRESQKPLILSSGPRQVPAQKSGDRKGDGMAARMRMVLADLYQDEEAASLVEYILLAVLIGVAAIAGLSFLGRTANNRMNNIGTTVQQQPS